MSEEAVLDLPQEPTTTTETTTQEGTSPQEPNEVQSALAELTKSVQTLAKSQTPPEQKKELTQEEKDELWKVYKPEKDYPDFFERFFKGHFSAEMDPASKAETLKGLQEMFGKFQTGIARQSVAGAMNLYQSHFQKFLDEEFAPMKAAYEEMQREKVRGQFFKKYPSLADPKFEKIITAAAGMIQKENKEFSNNDDYFKALADNAVGLIQGVIPEFKLDSQQPSGNTETAPRTTRTRVGGSGGAGNGSTPSNSGARPKGGDIASLYD